MRQRRVVTSVPECIEECDNEIESVPPPNNSRSSLLLLSPRTNTGTSDKHEYEHDDDDDGDKTTRQKSSTFWSFNVWYHLRKQQQQHRKGNNNKLLPLLICGIGLLLLVIIIIFLLRRIVFFWIPYISSYWLDDNIVEEQTLLIHNNKLLLFQQQQPIITTTTTTTSSSSSDYYYNVKNCPLVPPVGYPREYPILDVLTHWNTQNVNIPPLQIYQGICIFDFNNNNNMDNNNNMKTTETTTTGTDHNNNTYHQFIQNQIRNYQQAEVPFVIRNDPNVIKAVTKWNNPNYLSSQLSGKQYQATISNTTRMTYYSIDPEHNIIPSDFVPFTTHIPMTFEDWKKHASIDRSTSNDNNKKNHEQQQQQEQYAYLRLDACLINQSCDSTYRGDPNVDSADFIYDDLSFFLPHEEQSHKQQSSTTSTTTTSSSSSSSSSIYNITKKSRGIQCRFGSPGLVAENHFDNERNWIVMMGGARRYLLGHPKNCPTMYLYPNQHPLERHTQLDWSQPFQYYNQNNNNNNNNKNHDTTTTATNRNNRTNNDNNFFPNLGQTTINEIVLLPGDVLYLPTYWFHHIVSLTMNYQCNTRNGYSVEYDQIIYDCGFFYDFPE